MARHRHPPPHWCFSLLGPPPPGRAAVTSEPASSPLGAGGAVPPRLLCRTGSRPPPGSPPPTLVSPCPHEDAGPVGLGPPSWPRSHVVTHGPPGARALAGGRGRQTRAAWAPLHGSGETEARSSSGLLAPRFERWAGTWTQVAGSPAKRKVGKVSVVGSLRCSGWVGTGDHPDQNTAGLPGVHPGLLGGSGTGARGTKVRDESRCPDGRPQGRNTPQSAAPGRGPRLQEGPGPRSLATVGVPPALWHPQETVPGGLPSLLCPRGPVLSPTPSARPWQPQPCPPRATPSTPRKLHSFRRHDGSVSGRDARLHLVA